VLEQTSTTPSPHKCCACIPHPGQRGLSASNADTSHPELDNIKHVASSDPVPLIHLDVIAANGSCNTKALPDSGADISAAGKAMLSSLNAQVATLLPSNVIPKALNGAKMFPLGRLQVTFRYCDTEYRDDLHIYPEIQGTILSCKACKALRILPPDYPSPLPTLSVQEITSPSTPGGSRHPLHCNKQC